MTLAIMQPYLFPYIGYFQLINAVDKYVIYDDVSFIKGGWINRNNLLVNNKSCLFTVPLEKPSSFININQTNINLKLYELWRNKFLKTVEQSYKKAPNYSKVVELLSVILDHKGVQTISILALKSIISICNYLEMETKIIPSSEVFNNNHLNGQNRVLDICKQLEAKTYINPNGGASLYSKKDFKANSINLCFIKTKNIHYKQFTEEFTPWLSIIDILMFNSILETKELLKQYELL